MINKNTKVAVFGITGNQGSFHTKLMLDYGTNIVCGVTPKKGGQKVENVPVYNSIKSALKKHNPSWSVLFVPAPFVLDAATNSLENNLNTVIITEGVPVHDTLKLIKVAKKNKRILIGPNCPGIVSVNNSKIGIMPGTIFKKGDVGVVSRSGTLTYEVVNQLTQKNIGQSKVVGIGGDPIVGANFIDVLKNFESDNSIKKIVLIGEIGGLAEIEAAKYIRKKVSKQVVAFVAGKFAPKDKTMGHAGAIIEDQNQRADHKIKVFEKNNISVAKTPWDIPSLIKR